MTNDNASVKWQLINKMPSEATEHTVIIRLYLGTSLFWSKSTSSPFFGVEKGTGLSFPAEWTMTKKSGKNGLVSRYQSRP